MKKINFLEDGEYDALKDFQTITIKPSKEYKEAIEKTNQQIRNDRLQAAQAYRRAKNCFVLL